MEAVGARRAAAVAWSLAIAILAACGGPDDTPPANVAEREDALQPGTSSRPARPPGVPDDFVLTPHGYFHASCVVEVGEGDVVRDDGTVEVQGGGRRAVAACAHARYDRHGQRIERGDTTAPPPTVSGWVASVWSMAVGPVQSTSATWRVPAAPSNAGTQTLYFFNGLEPAASGAFILQPVLAWNGFSDRRWTIASWNCCTDGNVWHSAPRNVNAGDTITGSVTGSKCNAKGVCASWSVRAAGPRGAATTLATTAQGAVMDWAFSAAFEAYGVDTCSQYPANGGITFGSIVVRGTNGALVSPAWNPVSDDVDPACVSSVRADPASNTASMAWSVR